MLFHAYIEVGQRIRRNRFSTMTHQKRLQALQNACSLRGLLLFGLTLEASPTVLVGLLAQEETRFYCLGTSKANI